MAAAPAGVITSVDEPRGRSPRARPRGGGSPTASGSLGASLRRVFSPAVTKGDDPETEKDASTTTGEARPRRRFFARFCSCVSPDPGTVTEAEEVADIRGQLLGMEPSYVPKSPLLPDARGDLAQKPCLVLDLDETLVHSSFTPIEGADFEIPLIMSDETHVVFVKKRPGVDHFLEEVAKHYEVVVFTASLSLYADPVMELLDPERRVHARLYREHCVIVGGYYVKDIAKLGRDLKQTIIIDNSHVSYAFQPANAIPIEAFFDDETDCELEKTLTILERSRSLKDVRNLYSQTGAHL